MFAVPFQAGYEVCHMPLSCVVVLLLLKPVWRGTVTEAEAVIDLVTVAKSKEVEMVVGVGLVELD